MDKHVSTSIGSGQDLGSPEKKIDALRAEIERLLEERDIARGAENLAVEQRDDALHDAERLRGLLEGAGKAATGMLDTRDAEIERLRAALERIANSPNVPAFGGMRQIAREALARHNCQSIG